MLWEERLGGEHVVQILITKVRPNPNPIEDIYGHPEDFYRAHYTLAEVNE